MWAVRVPAADQFVAWVEQLDAGCAAIEDVYVVGFVHIDSTGNVQLSLGSPELSEGVNFVALPFQ